jgi:hypothetical protein
MSRRAKPEAQYNTESCKIGGACGRERAKREAREQDIALKAHNAKEHLVGEHLPEARQVFHVKVVSPFL